MLVLVGCARFERATNGLKEKFSNYLSIISMGNFWCVVKCVVFYSTPRDKSVTFYDGLNQPLSDDFYFFS